MTLFNDWISKQKKSKGIFIANDYSLIVGDSPSRRLVFAQLIYWFSLDSKNKSKLKIINEDKLWLAKSIQELANECGMAYGTVKKILSDFHNEGIIIKKQAMYYNTKVLHIHLNEAKIYEILNRNNTTKIENFESKINEPVSQIIKKTFPKYKKITYKFVKAEFKKYNYILLSTEYKTNKKLDFICDKGHIGSMLWNSFSIGHRCKQCYIEKCKIVNPNWKGGITKLNLPLFDKYAHQIDWLEEVRRDPDNNNLLQVRCTNCNKWVTPKRTEVESRLRFLKNSISDSCKFYCSDECKKSCSVFNRSKYPKGFKVDRSREVQPELATMVLERDNHECQRCGNKDDLECHHYEGIEQNPIESADIDACVTLCEGCHNLAHKDNGCRRTDLAKKELCK